MTPSSRAYTGVTELLTASHVDPLLGEGLHEHTWSVTAFYPSDPPRDGRALKAALRLFLDALPTVLPPELWAGEDIAKSVLVLANCIGARVTRPEGFEAWVWAKSAPRKRVRSRRLPVL